MSGMSKETLEVTRNFLAAMREIQPVFHFDERSFALAVDALRDCNPIAAKFFTHDGTLGRACSDFDEGLLRAQSNCLCFFQAPEYNKVEISFTHRYIPRFIGEHPEAVRELTRHYLENLTHV